MGRITTLLYAAICYSLFFLTFLYTIAFVGDFGVPLTIDQGRNAAMPAALIIDVLLLGLFAVQHSGMARRGYKRWLITWLPGPAERSTYVLLSSAALLLLYWQWRPLPAVVWEVEAAWDVWLLHGLYALGWLLVFTSTFVINHFDLFGLRQAWLHLRGRTYAEVGFKASVYYRIVRHPLMLGFLIAFWATPTMTVGHLVFAIATTAYIVLAIRWFEEPELMAMHGAAYRDYQRRVPMLCPWPRPRHTQRAVPPDKRSAKAG